MITRKLAIVITAALSSLIAMPAFAQTQQFYVQPQWHGYHHHNRGLAPAVPVNQQPVIVMQQPAVMAQPVAPVVMQQNAWAQQQQLFRARQQTAQFTANIQAQKAQIQQNLNARFSAGQLPPHALRIAARLNAQIDSDLVMSNQNGIIDQHSQFRIAQLLNRMATLQTQTVQFQPAPQPIMVQPQVQPVYQYQPQVQVQPVVQYQQQQVQPHGCGWQQ